jgi:hypothetical protein
MRGDGSRLQILLGWQRGDSAPTVLAYPGVLRISAKHDVDDGTRITDKTSSIEVGAGAKIVARRRRVIVRRADIAFALARLVANVVYTSRVDLGESKAVDLQLAFHDRAFQAEDELSFSDEAVKELKAVDDGGGQHWLGKGDRGFVFAG